MKQLFNFLLFVSLYTNAVAQDTTTSYKLFLGTGEYSPKDNWHGIIRMDSINDFGTSPDTVSYSPESTIPIKECLDNGVSLNFGHGFYYKQSNDELYVSLLFTNQNNIITTNTDTAKGSIAIFSDVSNRDSAQVDNFRHIFGDSTQLKQPHGCWVDESRDMLYVANTFGESILVYNNASTIDGNVAPDRVITNFDLGRPVYIFIDTVVDRMFVTCMGGMTGGASQVVIYNDASTIDGNVAPDIRIFGTETKLSNINATVHNVWFKGNGELIAVGHHTHELSIFDLSSIDLNPVTPTSYNISARRINVNNQSDLSDSVDVNLYGLFWDTKNDIIYCSVGADNPNGGPKLNSPPNAIKVYKNISDTSVHGFVTPDRVIYWDNGGTYFPPQPVWLVEKTTISNAIKEPVKLNQINAYPNPAKGIIQLEINSTKPMEVELQLFNTTGMLIISEKINLTNGKNFKQLNIEQNSKGIYLLKINAENEVISKKIVLE